MRCLVLHSPHTPCSPPYKLCQGEFPSPDFSPYKVWFLPLRSLLGHGRLQALNYVFCSLLTGSNCAKVQKGTGWVCPNRRLCSSFNCCKSFWSHCLVDLRRLILEVWAPTASQELRVIILGLAMTHCRACGKLTHLLYAPIYSSAKPREINTQFPDGILYGLGINNHGK